MRLGAQSYRPLCLLDHAGRLVPVQCCQAATLLAELVSLYCASQVQSLLSILACYWRRVACTCNSIEGYTSDNMRHALSGNGDEEGYDAPCRISGAFLKEEPQGVFFTFPSCTAFTVNMLCHACPLAHALRAIAITRTEGMTQFVPGPFAFPEQILAHMSCWIARRLTQP